MAVSETWTSFDPAGAAEWLSTLPAGPAYDSAVAHLVANITDDPVAAFAWGTQINDGQKRGSSLERVVRRWSRRDPEAAREAIDAASQLPADERQQLLEVIDESD